MKRITPLNLAAAAVVAGLLAATVALGSGAHAASKPAAAAAKQAGGFRQTLAAKLGEQLNKPTADVLAAMKTAHKGNKKTRADRLQARIKRLQQRASGHRAGKADRAQKQHAARDAWAAALATPLNVDASDVTAALRALVAQRLESLVRDGWLTTGKRTAELACFDDASKCQGVRTPGLALLRAGL